MPSRRKRSGSERYLDHLPDEVQFLVEAADVLVGDVDVGVLGRGALAASIRSVRLCETRSRRRRRAGTVSRVSSATRTEPSGVVVRTRKVPRPSTWTRSSAWTIRSTSLSRTVCSYASFPGSGWAGWTVTLVASSTVALWTVTTSPMLTPALARVSRVDADELAVVVRGPHLDDCPPVALDDDGVAAQDARVYSGRIRGGARCPARRRACWPLDGEFESGRVLTAHVVALGSERLERSRCRFPDPAAAPWRRSCAAPGPLSE